MKILFMGTPEFAVPCLDILIKEGHNICGVVTQPDKPKGRGHKMMPPPVKVRAEENNIPVFQPETLKGEAFLPELEQLNPDVIIVVAYGKILPEYVLNFPKYGCINVHGSLLPKYRGAAPIQWSIINGETETGITTMYMEKGLDTGDMIFKSFTPISPEDTYETLHDRLSQMGADLIAKTVAAAEEGELPREKQNDDLSCYAPMISRETGHINWSEPAHKILNLIRGLNPFPASYTMYGDEVLKIYHARMGHTAKGNCGEFKVTDKMFEVVCGDGMSILIDEIQFKGGKRMSVSGYLNGHSVDENIILN